MKKTKNIYLINLHLLNQNHLLSMFGKKTYIRNDVFDTGDAVTIVPFGDKNKS